MTRLRKLLLFAPLFLLQVGCSSTSNTSTGQVDANGEPVSSVPWNKPETWETTGQLGGMSGQ
jgi:hypothetical protein